MEIDFNRTRGSKIHKSNIEQTEQNDDGMSLREYR